MKYLAILFLLAVAPLVGAQAKVKPAEVEQKYPRGRVQSPDDVVAARHAEAFKRHRYRTMVRSAQMQAALPDEFDASKMGWTTEPTDQGSCGDCFGDSSTRIFSAQRKKGGYLNVFTYQYGLDYRAGQGQCNGGDEAEVINDFKVNGWPDTSAYPYPYIARPGGKRTLKGPLIKLEDWGYATPAQEQGIANTEDIMAMIFIHGEGSTAVCADGVWDSYSDGIMTYRAYGANSCNHAISIYGWKKDASVKNGGYWLARNNWGKSWGINGDLKIPFKSHAIGTEFIWLSVTPLAPPPPDPPNPPPPPVPPIPPTPGSVQITLTPAQVQSVLTQAGAVVVVKNADGSITLTLPSTQAPMPIEKEPPLLEKKSGYYRLDESGRLVFGDDPFEGVNATLSKRLAESEARVMRLTELLEKMVGGQKKGATP